MKLSLIKITENLNFCKSNYSCRRKKS